MADDQYYQYDPSLPAAGIFATLFALSSVVHLFQLLQKRTWYFIPFLVGGLFETIGYFSRAVNASKTPNWAKVPFIIESLVILLGPALFAASIYMVLGRIIRSLSADHLSWIPTRWLTKVFVCGDVISFFMQCAGGGILATANDRDKQKLGENVILAGLGVQILFFGCFMVVISRFHYSILRSPTPTSIETRIPWKAYIIVLYFVSLLILIRSLFRVVEYGMGKDGVLQGSEVYLYCFDAVLMLLVAVTLNWCHPSRVVSRALSKGHSGEFVELMQA